MNYLDHFKELAKIPHGSGNTDKICSYLYDFAIENGCLAKKDDHNNLYIMKPAHPDLADRPGVILQGHMDMVAVKEPGCEKDMKTEGLDLYEEDGFLCARGTSLGGDDGIAVAYIMDILTGEYKAPMIEAVITADEEIGMIGANAFDAKDVKSKRMINIDQEEEGIFVVSCAGGSHVAINIPTQKLIESGLRYRIEVKGLKGGHSGIEINKPRGNAIKILSDELCKLYERVDFKLIDISGGEADNAIPKSCYADIMLTDDSNQLILNEVKKLNGEDFNFGDENDYDSAYLSVSLLGDEDYIVFDDESTGKVLSILKEAKNGVISMDENNEDFVQTSLNIGIVRTDEENVDIDILVRSSVEAEKNALVFELCKLAKKYDSLTEIDGDYPGWAYRSDSPLRDTFVEVSEELGLCKPKCEAIHAGLECGIFASKIEGLDCISVGPTIEKIHTTEERLNIASADRCFKLLTGVLEKL
ncbi:MAG: beta-Ala-His dipeptidase [Lachnospiraceae bacterium]|nr:beta-Ala-His dipeptidase [Lachnospiraceae bacterium]